MGNLPGRGTSLRPDVRAAIEKLWPEGILQSVGDPEKSYFGKIYPKLVSAMRRFKEATLIFEGPSQPEPHSRDNDDFEDDPPLDDYERSRSYHLFFITPNGEAFSCAIETGDPDEPLDDEQGEQWPAEAIAGNERTGWSVAVSLLAPFATVTLSDMAEFEDGSIRVPSIESPRFSENGERPDAEADFKLLRGEQAFAVLLKLRGRIVDILSRNGIAVLPEDEWQKPLLWMRAEEEVLLGISGEPIRVLDAFFFEML